LRAADLMKVWHNQNRLPFDVGPNSAQGDNSCHPMPRKLAGELEKNGLVAPLLWEQTYPRHEIRGSVLAPVSGAHPVVVNSHRCSSLNSHKLERAHFSEAAGPLQAQHQVRSLNMAAPAIHDPVHLTVHCRSGRAVQRAYSPGDTVETVLKDMVHDLRLRWPQVLCNDAGDALQPGLTLDQCGRPANLRIEVGSPTSTGWSASFAGSCIPPPHGIWNPAGHQAPWIQNSSFPVSYAEHTGICRHPDNGPVSIPVLGARAPGCADGRSCDKANVPAHGGYGEPTMDRRVREANVRDFPRLR